MNLDISFNSTLTKLSVLNISVCYSILITSFIHNENWDPDCSNFYSPNQAQNVTEPQHCLAMLWTFAPFEFPMIFIETFIMLAPNWHLIIVNWIVHNITDSVSSSPSLSTSFNDIFQLPCYLWNNTLSFLHLVISKIIFQNLP